MSCSQVEKDELYKCLIHSEDSTSIPYCGVKSPTGLTGFQSQWGLLIRPIILIQVDLKCKKKCSFKFSYLILSASCSVFSLISTMTWDTGFNIRLSTFTCKKRKTTRYSDSLSPDSTEDSHGDHQHTNTPHLCSAPAAAAAAWSSPSDQRSSAQAPASMSSPLGLADSLIQPLEHHRSAATQPKFTFVFLRIKGDETELCGTTKIRKKKTNKEHHSTPSLDWLQRRQRDTCLVAHRPLPHHGSLWLRWRGLSPNPDSTYRKLISAIES